MSKPLRLTLRNTDKRQEGCEGNTDGERLLPAGSHDGGSDDGDVELVLLLLHHELGQSFGVGVGVGPVTDEPRRDVPHDAVIHPPADTKSLRRKGRKVPARPGEDASLTRVTR